MNPNSEHQLWSKWTFVVTPAIVRARAFSEVKANCARFGRKAFGAASEMRLTSLPVGYRIEIRTEGHPVHEVAYVSWMEAQWRRFFVEGFGVGTRMTCVTKLEAGDRQDGRPADQLIIVPPIAVQGGLS